MYFKSFNSIEIHAIDYPFSRMECLCLIDYLLQLINFITKQFFVCFQLFVTFLFLIICSLLIFLVLPNSIFPELVQTYNRLLFSTGCSIYLFFEKLLQHMHCILINLFVELHHAPLLWSFLLLNIKVLLFETLPSPFWIGRTGELHLWHHKYCYLSPLIVQPTDHCTCRVLTYVLHEGKLFIRQD